MWDTLSAHIPALLGGITALAAAIGAWLRFRPRRIIGWLSAVKEREMLLAMLESEKQWGLYWKTQADQCFDRLREIHK